MKYICIWLIKLYQKFLSPLKRTPTCRFTPTCSAYAVEAFRKRGFIIGIMLTVYRIMRCNPFSFGGYDPVPEKGEKWNPVKRYEQMKMNGELSDTEDPDEYSDGEEQNPNG